MHAPTRTLHRRSGSTGDATPREGSRPLASLCLPSFRTRRLARMSDSLVRVSRRVGWGAHWPMPRSRVYPAGHADGAHHVLDRIDGIPSNERSVRASAVDAARIDPHPEPSDGPANRRSASDRVLFIFPSRYLFAIGLSPIFSLRQNLPPDWGCIPKKPNSSTAPRGATGSEPN
ncbi:unnamed protein product, partial [Musa acuminata var. zebrina]